MNILGEITHIEGRFNSDTYLEILEEVMLPSVRAYNFPYPEQYYFVQDRCPVHMSRAVRTWFAEHQEIELLDWPSQGCDMNPIENLWGIMVNEWKDRQERTTHQLYAHISEVWESVRRRPRITENLVASMPRRLQAVIDKEGGWTKY